MTEQSVNEIVARDGQDVVAFWKPQSLEGEFFLTFAPDGKGYASIAMSADDWAHMRSKVDALVAKYLPEPAMGGG